MAVTAITVWTLTRTGVETSPDLIDDNIVSGSAIAPAESSSPLVETSVATSEIPVVVSTQATTKEPSSQSESVVTVESAKTDSPAIDSASDDSGLSQDELTEIGTAAYSDGEFELLKQLIREQPIVLQQLLEEFRANTDPDRAGRLAELLGQFDDQSITDIGAEMAFSGELMSQKAGLELLGRQQSRSPAARAAVTQLLEVESNAEVLVPALNAIAKSSRVDVGEQQHILDQLSHLSAHDDPKVRSHSIALIKSWSRDVNMNAVLLQGLQDTNVRVRESAAFALVRTQYPTEDVKLSLLSRLEDLDEKKSIREAAFNALRRMKLTYDEQTRLDAALKLLNQ